MRIHSLRFAALGPFAGEEFIDFDALGPSALFLIDGPTGAGKSTIIDAIVFALYGDVAGEASDKERLRSAFASPDSESFAELDFSSMTGRYRVRRTPAYERAKKRGTGTTAEPATVQVFRFVGEQTWEALSVRHAEADAEISQAVGLSRSQFLQTVVLPQGEFATFLRAESADRLPILERIFATEVYGRIQAAFDEERRVALREREQSMLALQSCRDVLRGQLEGSAVSIESVHDLETWPEQRDEVLTSLRTNADAANAATAQADAVLTEATARMDVLVAAEQAAKAQGAAEIRLAQIDAKVAELQFGLELGAETGSLDELVVQLENELETCAAEAAVESSLPELERQAAAALARVARLTEAILELEHDRDQEIPTRMAAYVAGLHEEVRIAEQSVLAQERHVGALRAARIAGLSGELALALIDGAACPVCGALDHPSPAPLRPDHVSSETVEEQETSLEAEREQLQKLSTSVAVIANSVPDGAPAAEPSQESRTTMLDALQKEIDALGGIGLRIEESQSQRAVAQNSHDELVSRITADRARVEASRGEYSSVSDRADVIRARRDSLIELREARALQEQARQQLESLAGDESAPPPGVAELATAQTQRDEANAAARRATAVSTSAARLLQVVGELCSNVDTAQKEHERVIRDSAATIRLAQALTGAKGQSLSAYVVQRAFDEVVEAANIRLAAMLGGHFRLVTTQERTGSRRTGLGLGLKVRDLRTDTERRTTTLSGGESFCASLALALGLADSVRAHAGGVEIGMLFIDEGFGALDVERLGDVMAELLRLRADGRTVGVISHVTEMKRAIPERIDVLPAASGSTLSVRWMG
jgi:DNA repair protein SbcC/Rad50